MSKGLDHDSYISLLEQSVKQSFVTSGPENQKPAGDRFPGKDLGYRGVTLKGDDILNWGGDNVTKEKKNQPTGKESKKNVEDIEEEEIATEGDEFDDSPMSLLEGSDFDSTDDLYRSYLNEDSTTIVEDDSDVNEYINEQESEVLSRLIHEMNLLEQDDDDDDDDTTDEVPEDDELETDDFLDVDEDDD